MSKLSKIDRLTFQILLRQLDAGQRGEGGHEIQSADDVMVLAGRP